ncbi:MAG: efflux RND transporter permease subunit [Lautropia sp.]|nr:efflux RND transporter permease subunit [Lautropia sp.]
MSVSAWSIRNPIAVILLFVMLTIAGLVSFHRMQVQNMPDMDFPMVTIAASLEGATPGQLENDVARRIENALVDVQGIRHISTTLGDGAVALMVQFELDKPVQEALDQVRSKVQSVRADLPSDLPDPIVDKVDLATAPVLAYSIESEHMDIQELSWFVDNELERMLLGLKGVGKVTRVGGVSREVHVDLDPHRLRALGLTVAEVSQQLRSNQLEGAGGHADIAMGRQPTRVLSRVASAEQLKQVQISTSDGRRLVLGDLGTVTDTVADKSSSAWLNGREIVGFEISRSRGDSEVEVGKRVRAMLHKLQMDRPDLKLTETMDLVSIARNNFDNTMHTLYEGAVLAVVVVWLFLRTWRATFVAAVALPMSVIPAFLGMYLFDFSLNGVSLLALTLVIGVLVDDAIVEIENIERHLQMGKTPYQAAMEAAEEIGLAVIATTFSLIAVFLPTAFMSGIIGRFFKQFGWTAALAVFASLVVARMLTPMMAAYMLAPRTGPEREPAWQVIYLRVVRWVLAHRLQTTIYTILFFVASLMLGSRLSSAFIPPDDYGQTQVQLKLGPGATLAQTERAAEAARRLLEKVPHVHRVYTAIGAGSGNEFSSGLSSTNYAVLTIDIGPRGKRPRKQAIERSLREALQDMPGARVGVGQEGSSGASYAFVLSSSDNARLAMAAKSVERDLRALKGVGNVTSSTNLVRTEVIVRPDAARAASLGVSAQAISNALRLATQGDYEQALPKLNLEERQIPIVVRLARPARESLAALQRILVQGANGPVMLQQVATLELGGGPAIVSRRDRARNVEFEVELGDKGLGELQQEVMALPSISQLPAGVSVEAAGDAEMMADMFSSFSMAMLTGVLCIWMVLVLLFRSFLHPVTILSALPLAVGGSFVALLLGRFAMSMPALIGLVMLMGIVTKNSILLVEYAIVARRDHGMDRWHALMDACAKRGRPIIMTTLAMGAGMLPAIIGNGSSDNSFSAPMGAAVLGGLITSTALSLLVVPAVFTYVDDMGQWVMRRCRRGVA